ncbi:MAG: alpha/beta hydrolase [Brevundimonas sp.]|nr:MAG: alpha/beta hydrolase [Brevundimonas sp.]
MTILSLTVAAVVAAAPAQVAAPDLGGAWEGRLAVAGQSIRIVFNVAVDGTTTMDSPDQGARGIAAQSSIEGRTVRFTVGAIGGRFEGVLAEDGRTITGSLSQGGITAPMMLTRGEIAAGPSRPQTPRPPFPYRSEPVAYDNPAAPGVRLAGTLTLPQGPGPFPAAILISGTGPQDRDETIEAHKPFAIWADALTRRGVAVLRLDDRGVGASNGNYGAATQRDFASDVKAAFDGLAARPDIDGARIGLIGHSEGGIFAPMAMQDGARAAWLATLAGPAVPGGEIIEEQARRMGAAAGMAPETLARNTELQHRIMVAVATHADDAEAVRQAVMPLLLEAGQTPEVAARTAAAMSSDWYRGMVAHDPADSLRAVRVPMLALYGEKDLQVPADQNGAALSRLKPDATVVVLPGLNHLFQPAETGLPAEYGAIETSIDPTAISTVVDWIVARSGVRP